MKRKKAAIRKKTARTSHSRWLELSVAVVIFFSSALWGSSYWQSWIDRGNKPVFYQLYFEPAVMIACGKGFLVSRTQPANLVEFLSTRSDRFDCADIPKDAVLDRELLYQGAWRYLLTTVGWFWRIRGISWSGMGPLFGFLFGVTITLVYATCRLGMNRTMAILIAVALSMSALHLTNLPHLRDYAKAPFTLALILILGLLVKLPIRWQTVLGLSAAYGAVVGIGYGFRTDFLVNLPVLPIVLFFFLACSLKRNLLLKAGATIVFLTTFLIVSWPVTSTVYAKGGCQWHVTLLGLQAPFDPLLHIQPAPYDFGYAYMDGYIAQNVDAFASRMSGQPTKVGYCTPEYDAQSWKLLKNLIVSFPADFVTRAFASVGQIVELPFTEFRITVPMWPQATIFHSKLLTGAGKFVIVVCLLSVSAFSFRLAFFMLFFVLYFGGYPAVQFQDRHYFQLEFITWWALGFLAYQAAHLSRRPKPSLDWKVVAPVLRRMAMFAAFALVMILVPLGLLRWYQERQASKLLTAYLEAPKQSILSGPVTQDGLYVVEPSEIPAQFLEVDMNLKSCGPSPSVSFRYDPLLSTQGFERAVNLKGASGLPGVTRVFILVFDHFKGIQFSGVSSGCVVGAYRLTDTRQYPSLVNAVLSPDWSRLPLHQRLKDW